jgi:hypothetical protein
MPVISVLFGIVIRMYYREPGVGHFTRSTMGDRDRYLRRQAARWKDPVADGHAAD